MSVHTAHMASLAKQPLLSLAMSRCIHLTRCLPGIKVGFGLASSDLYKSAHALDKTSPRSTLHRLSLTSQQTQRPRTRWDPNARTCSAPGPLDPDSLRRGSPPLVRPPLDLFYYGGQAGHPRVPGAAARKLRFGSVHGSAAPATRRHRVTQRPRKWTPWGNWTIDTSP